MGNDAYRPITTETKLSLPLNGSIFTTTRPVASEKVTPTIGASMLSELGEAWKDSLIISTNLVPVDSMERQQIVHARIPRETDQLASNWEYSTCSIGGRQFPSVQRTVILVAKADLVPSGVTMDVVAYATPTIGSAMPVETGSIFTDKGFILADRQVASSGMQLEPVFRVERRNYIVRTTRKSIGVDPLNGKALWTETTLYYTGEVVTGSTTVDQLFADPTNAYWGTQTDATRRTGERLSCAWFSITTELLVAGTNTGGVVEVDSIESDVDFYWPPVLQSLNFLSWARRDGGSDIYPNFKFDPEGYSGPCKSLVTRTWKSTPFTGLYSEKLLPKPINYASPFFNLNVPACLHTEQFAVCNIGSGDPVYAVNSGSSQTFEATQKMTSGGLTAQTSWPASIRAYDQQQAFRGGYLRTVRTVYKPDS